MFIRIVKLTFEDSFIEQFQINFENQKDKIKGFKGCLHLELLQDKDCRNRFFTYSHWDKEESLENYRNSELFKGIWAITKPHFIEKPEAWSVDRKKIVD